MIFKILMSLGPALLLAAPGQTETLELDKYAQQMTIQGVEQAGDHRFVVTPELYGASQTRPDLRDLRILGPDGKESPWLKRPVWRPNKRQSRTARVYDPLRLPDGGSQAVLDLGENPPAHNRMVLDIHGHDYLRQARIESSRDGKDFGLLSQGAYVFDISTQGARARRTELRYPNSQARYLRVSLLPGSDPQALTITGARILGLEHEPAEASEVFVPLAISARPERKDKQTILELEKLPAGVPLTALKLKLGPGEFVRRVKVEGSTRKQAWFTTGGGVLYRVKRLDAGDAVTIDENLELPIDSDQRSFLRLVIDDGDDQPLDVQAVEASYRLEEVIFRARQAGAHHLLVGFEEAQSPRYDLDEQLARGGGGPIALTRLGPLQPNSDFGKKKQVEEAPPWSERFKLPLQIGIGVLALLLAAWTVMLLRRGGREQNR